MGSPRIRRYWDLILTKSWFWIVFSCLIRIFTLKNSIKKLSGPATPLKWKTHFRCHFGANQKFCRMYFTLMFLGFHISIMFGSFSDLFFFHADFINALKNQFWLISRKWCGIFCDASVPAPFWQQNLIC